MSVPREVRVAVLREQGGPPNSKAVCPLCGKARGCSDAHHWLFKQNHNIPDDIANQPINIVMLCHCCHMRAGQIKETTEKLLKHKLLMGYDVFDWFDGLVESGYVKHLPDIANLKTFWRKTMLEKDKRISAFCKIIHAFRKSLVKPVDMRQQPIHFIGHLFDSNKNTEYCEFSGMSSDDIYSLVFYALSEPSMPIIGLRFWFVPQEASLHHQIFAEIETEFETFFCSGMTDYSGAGSVAYSDCCAMFELLSSIYDVPIERNLIQQGADKKAWIFVNEARKAVEETNILWQES